MLIYAFVILTALGIISAILNGLLTVVFIKGYSCLKKMPYFYFCIQILLCNLAGLVVKFSYVIPNAAMDDGDKVLPETYIAVMALIETITYHGELSFILALAIHRLLVFFNFPWALNYKFCFFQIFISWLFVCLFVIGQCLFECFDTSISPNSIENGVWDGVKFYSMCDESTFPRLAFKFLIAVVNDYLPAVTLLFYFLIIIKIRVNVIDSIKTCKFVPVSTVNKRPQQQDVVIFSQAFTTWVCFFIKFRILNNIGYGDNESSLSVFLKCIIYVSIYVRDTTQAVYLLAFNQNVRNIARNMFCQGSKSNKVMAIQDNGAAEMRPRLSIAKNNIHTFG